MLKNIFLILILLSTTVYAAEIKGTIYDTGLNKVKNSIVEVNSVPQQRLVSKDGTYSFNLPAGDYVIKARFEDTEAKEQLKIEKEGVFILDLFLFPTFEENLNEEIDIPNLEEPSNTKYYIIYIVGALLIIFIIFYKYRYKKKETLQNEVEDNDELMNKILELIKRHNNRTTQREIRKEINLSEAKISLILTELEHKGKIKKIKKGRGNIIILQH